MDLFRAQGRVGKQAFIQMGRVPVRMPRGSHALIHLHHLQAQPGNILVGQRPQHEPGSAAATDGQQKAATCGDAPVGVCGDHGSRSLSNRIGIGKHFYLHGASSIAAKLFKDTVCPDY
jgi:hypothetical protein